MAELENNIAKKRQIAYKIRIKDILESQYFKEDGWLPNYIQVNGNKISRINLIGTIVLKVDENSLIVDDGSGRISLRVFENNNIFSGVDIGDIILIIGRPREYGSEKYILPEIIKKIENNIWINVRKKELKLSNNYINKDIEKEDELIQEETIEEVSEDESLSEKIFNLIKQLDNGDGVNTSEILENINEKEGSDIIKRLLENGEVFEVKPGKLKVLE